ncbi:hypothetical protein CMUS01_13191 [Colletotrichum musicola]|uniref:Uncharacterized protein n=1 Tax=Colletotrichum musicola TaxID=2175873 RepID=A0A8H6MWR2_9PEZI|nr:hypothetical protein CMUS01_13191 [Colletotrichum musicola]
MSVEQTTSSVPSRYPPLYDTVATGTLSYEDVVWCSSEAPGSWSSLRQTIYLIDTPGFHPAQDTSAGVLRKLKDCFNAKSDHEIKLDAILYFCDPTEDFATFEAMTLPIIQDLSGSDTPKKLTFIVSTLSRKYNPKFSRPQAQVQKQGPVAESYYWVAIISAGAKIYQDDGTVESALKLINRFVEQDKHVLDVGKHDLVKRRPTQHEVIADLDGLLLKKPDCALLPKRGSPYPHDEAEMEDALHLIVKIRQERRSVDQSKPKKEELSEPSGEMEDPRVPPSLIPGVLLTDSGYASAQARSGMSKHAHGQAPFSAFRYNWEGASEKGPPYPDSIPEAATPDDTTVYSTSSTAHSEILDGYITAMTRELVDLIPSVTTQNPATMSRLVQSLPEILKAFSLMIGHCADSSWHQDIVYFVHKHRSEIVDQFTHHVVKEESSYSSETVPVMTVDEKMSHWHDQTSIEAVPGMSVSGAEYISSDNSNGEPFLAHNLASNGEDNFGCEAAQEQPWENEDALNTGHETEMLLKHREYLINSSAYDWLRNALEREILLEPAYPDVRGGIRLRILDSLPPQRLNRVRGSQSYEVVFEMDWDPHVVTAISAESSFIVSATGSTASIAELAELLSWLGAALRPSPLEQGVIYCTPHISRLHDQKGKRPLSWEEELRFRMGFELSQNHVQTSLPHGQCWHGMFRNPVVVCGYPIARRGETETGLEMPLDMMALMIRTRRIVPFGDTYFLKGFSSMLALVERKGDTFLWHHVYNRDGSHVSYFEYEPVLKDNPTFQQLMNARHVVGWCSEVKFYAGMVSLSGGKFVSAGVGIRIGVAQTPVHIARETYFEKMKWATRRYTIFWDEEENRGWLVNGPSALLHLVLASIENDLSGKLKSNIIFRKESLEMPKNQYTTYSALEVLTNQKNKELKIHIDKVETWTEEETTNKGDALPTMLTKTKTTYSCFEDRVEQIYCFLEQAMEHQTSVERQDGVDLKWRARKHLEGWDFKDFATSEDFIYPRVKTLQTFAKGWVDFAREINAVTIFGKKFGEIIPCISDLKEAPEIVFSGNAAKVGKRVIWHVPDDLFKPCQCTANKDGKADHSHIVQGAVIFGYNSKFPLRWLDSGDPAEEEIHEEHLLAPPQPREEEFHDSGIGSSAIGSSSASGDGQTDIIHVLTAPPTKTDSKKTSEIGAGPSKVDDVDRYTEPASASGHVPGEEASEESEASGSQAGETTHTQPPELPRGASLRKRFKGGVKAFFARNIERVRRSR